MIANAHPLGKFAAQGDASTELLLALLALGIGLWLGRRRVHLALRRGLVVAALRPRRTILLAVTITLLLGWIAAGPVLDGFPNSADEYGDLFLAETLSRGRLWNPLPPAPEFFDVMHVGQRDGRWVSRFPPGWPALLALAQGIGLAPWTVNPMLAACWVLVVAAFARRFCGRRAAVLALMLFIPCGFFLLSAGSLRSHMASGLWVALAILGVARGVEDRSSTWAFIGGVSAGLALATRPFTAVACAIPLALYLIARRSVVRPRVLAAMALGAVPATAALLAYNAQITGSALRPVTTWIDPDEGLGFVRGHTVWAALRRTALRGAAFVEWSNPLLLPAWAMAVIARGRGSRGPVFFAALTFPALVLGHAVYHAVGGTQYGPRFWIEALPFVAVAVADWLVRREMRRAGPRGWSQALAIGMIFSALSLPFIARHWHRVVVERQDLYRQVERADLRRALVFVAIPAGTAWPMPVGDLIRNGTEVGGPVIFARDLGARNAELLEIFPDRAAFRYAADPISKRPTLRPLPDPAPR